MQLDDHAQSPATANAVAATLAREGFCRHVPDEREGYKCTQLRRPWDGAERGQRISVPDGPVTVRHLPKFEGVISKLSHTLALERYVDCLRKAGFDVHFVGDIFLEVR
jgi:hypothetical protein